MLPAAHALCHQFSILQRFVNNIGHVPISNEDNPSNVYVRLIETVPLKAAFAEIEHLIRRLVDFNGILYLTAYNQLQDSSTNTRIKGASYGR